MKIQKNKNELIDLVNKTYVTITKQNLVRPTEFILITVSGGQDSICLFFILLQLKKQWKWNFGILYCNHFWQIEAFYTSSLIFKLGFLFLIPAYLSLPSENIFSEQKSRNWRYSKFRRLSHFYNYNIVVTGHTATDRIETILLQLIRGTSTRGLTTLNWFRPISGHNSKMYRLRSNCSNLIPHSQEAMFKTCSEASERLTYKTLGDYRRTSTKWKTFVCASHKFWSLQTKLTTLPTNLLTKGVKLPNLFDEVSLPKLSNRTDLSILASTFRDLEKSKVSLYDFESQMSLKSVLVRDFHCVTRQSRKLSQFSFFPLIRKQQIQSKKFGKKKNDLSVKNEQFVEDFCSQVVFKLQNHFLNFDFCDNQNNRSSQSKQVYFQAKIEGLLFPFRYSATGHGNVNIEVFSENKNNNFLKQQNFFFALQKIRSIASHHLIYEGFISYAYQTSFKSYAFKLRKKSNFFNINTIWIYDDFLFLTFEKLRIVDELYKLNYFSCQQIFVACPFYFGRFQVFSIYKLTLSTIILNYTNCYKYKNNLLFLSSRQRQKLSSLESHKFAQRGKFKEQKLFTENTNITTEVCLSEVSVKLFRFQIQPQNPLRSTISWKFCYAVRQHDKFSNFKFKTVFFNAKSCKILIKFLKVSYWVEFKQKFSEFECFEFKNSVDFENSKYLIKPYLFLSHYQQFQIKILIYKNFFTSSPKCVRSTNQGPSLQAQLLNKVFQTTLVKLLLRGSQNLNPIFYVSKKNTLITNDLINKNINLKFTTPNEILFSLRKIQSNEFLIFRPLLFINRFDLKQLCDFLELPVYPDQTNEKLTYYRNRIRKQLLPLLRFFFNPQIDKLFLQFAEIANTEQLYLESVSTRLQQEFKMEKKKTFECNVSLFHFIPIAIQRRLLKQFLDKYLTKKIKFFHIEILLNLIIKKKKAT